MDRDLRYVFAEGEALSMAGFSSQMFEGKTIWQVLDKATAKQYEPFFVQGFQNKSFRYEHKNHDRYFVSQGMPLCVTETNVTHILVLSYDITEHKRVEEALRESEERFRTMADGLPLIIWVHDAEGRQQFVNTTFLEYFNLSQAEIDKGVWQSLLDPETKDRYMTEFFQSVRDQKEFNARVRVRRADGEWRWLESWGRPRCSASGEFLGFVGSSADVTDQINAQKVLQEINTSLEYKVVERTRKIKQQSDQLRALANRLSETEQRERKRLAQVLHTDRTRKRNNDYIDRL